MKFLPYEELVYHSVLRPDDVIYRLGENLEPERTFRMKGIFFTGSDKPYEGWVSDEGRFSIRRVIAYKNSFLPVIEGEIVRESFGSRIKVKMRLHRFVLVFMIVWMTIVGIAAFAMTVAFLNDPSIDRMSIIPIGMFGFGYLLTILAFKYESNRSKKELAKLFEAELEEK